MIITLVIYLLFLLSINLMTTNKISLFNFTSKDGLYIEAMTYSAFVLGTLLTSFISYIVIKQKKISIKDYLIEIFMNFLFVFLIECVILAGILILYLICEVLLGGIPYYIISRIIVFLITIITFMGFFIGIENTSKEHSVFSKILVRYIMQFMVFIGFIIFYIYLVKIIMNRELPSNQVFSVCTTLFSIGLLISLMSLSIQKNTEYNKEIIFLPIAFIPALILQIISIFIRINQYGLTTTRYIGVIVIIFEIVYLIYYIFDEILKNNKIKLENIFLPFCIIIIVGFLIPKINVYELPILCNTTNTKNINENTVENDIEIEELPYMAKRYEFEELDIKGYDIITDYHIYLQYDIDSKEYKISNDHMDKQIDKSEVNVSNLIEKINKNIKKYGIKYSSPILNDVENYVIEGNKKLIIKEIGIRYNDEFVVSLNIHGFLLSKLIS